jgi:sigma-B regulation protein RsbU (phosphoserine phosphatase)
MPPAIASEWTGSLEAPPSEQRRAPAHDRLSRLAERATRAVLHLEAGRRRRMAASYWQVALWVVPLLLTGATFIDLVAGPSIEAGLIYVLPVFAACLLLGRWGALMVPLCVGLFHVNELIDGQKGYLAANDLLKLGSFSMVAALTLLARLFYLDLAAAGHDLMARRRELESDIALAARLQACLYNIPTEGYRQGSLVIHATCRPLGAVGGDLCHLIPHDGGVHLFVGDVIGKGVPAALVMSMCTAILARSARPSLSPGQALRECNRLLSQHFDPDPNAVVTATAFFGAFQSEWDELIFSLAGHEAPILLGDMAIENPSRGILMGAVVEAEYPEVRVPFGGGSKLVVFTDGAVEIRGPRGEEFGRERLEAAALRWRHLPAPELLHQLLAEIDAFTDGAPQRDDLAVVVVEREA